MSDTSSFSFPPNDWGELSLFWFPLLPGGFE
jgi:hypothetical protein